MNNKVSKNVSIIMLIIGLLLISISIIFINNFKKSNEKENEKDNDSNIIETPLKDIEIDSKEKMSLFLVPKIVRNENNLDYYNVFQSKKVEVKDIDMNILIANLISYYEDNDYDGCTDEDVSINGTCDFIVELDKFKTKFENTYDRKFESIDSVKGSGVLSCKLNKDHYACTNTGGSWFSNQIEYYFTEIITDLEKGMMVQDVKAEKNNKYMYAYQKYAEVRIVDKESKKTSPSDYKFRLYKYSDNDTLITEDVINGEEYYDSNEEGGTSK